MPWNGWSGSTRGSRAIRKTITPHVFRVTTATSMLRAGANVRHVQELLRTPLGGQH
ncbi:MAG: tyrosine-type recombinase/integrase [Deltaproteobacteria bacterium]|nr:tyrosine-type recombinase/integrase [Deltaproteobacteria bacterium]